MFIIRGSYSRTIKCVTKTISLSKYDLQSPNINFSCLSYVNSFNKNHYKSICEVVNSININSTREISSTNYLKDSLKPIEIPPLPPKSSESDVFGTLGNLKYESVELDSEELKEEERLKKIRIKVPRKFKPSPGQYAKMIKTHVTKGDLESAEKVIELCKRNRDKPTEYMYALLINAFATHADLKKCYKYYSEMKSRDFEIKANIYTSVFNACANSPDTDRALDYLQRIMKHMEKYDFNMNHAHYNCLVKAYGRHKQLEEANKVVQQMLDKKLKIGISTINSLMYAANSNKESGLKSIIQYWQLMRKLKIPPDIFSYNLLLRGIRDTNFGGSTINDLLLPEPETEQPAVIIDKNRPDLLAYPPVISDLPISNIQKEGRSNISGLLSPPKSKSGTIPSESIKTEISESANQPSTSIPDSIANIDLDIVLKENKLILFGGFEGLLERMKNDRIQPNIKTLSYLAEVVPNSVAAENAVIKYAKSNKIQLDIEFFNMLIKKRCVRGLKKEAKELIEEIHKHDLRPNIVTYGVLALSCTSPAESRELIRAMATTGHVINKYVADSLLSTAFKIRDFPFILELMELMKKEKVRLDEETFEKLDDFQKKMSELVRTKHKSAKKDNFKVGFSKFNMRYKSWQVEMGRNLVVEKNYKM